MRNSLWKKHIISGTLIEPEIPTYSGYIWSEDLIRQAIQELMVLFESKYHKSNNITDNASKQPCIGLKTMNSISIMDLLDDSLKNITKFMLDDAGYKYLMLGRRQLWFANQMLALGHHPFENIKF